MTNIPKLPLVLLAATLGFALPAALQAQESAAPTPKSPSMMDHGSMTGEDMRDMMNMMGQTSQMMVNCNRMMQSANESQSGTNPPKEERGG